MRFFILFFFMYTCSIHKLAVWNSSFENERLIKLRKVGPMDKILGPKNIDRHWRISNWKWCLAANFFDTVSNICTRFSRDSQSKKRQCQHTRQAWRGRLTSLPFKTTWNSKSSLSATHMKAIVWFLRWILLSSGRTSETTGKSVLRILI